MAQSYSRTGAIGHPIIAQWRGAGRWQTTLRPAARTLGQPPPASVEVRRRFHRSTRARPHRRAYNGFQQMGWQPRIEPPPDPASSLLMEDNPMKIIAKPLTHALAALALTGAAISPAVAASTAGPMTQAVATADINLATAQGQRVLDQRIERAARNVCRVGKPLTGTRIANPEDRACLARARADARQQVAVLNGPTQRGG
jgi:UrcA family protein